MESEQADKRPGIEASKDEIRELSKYAEGEGERSDEVFTVALMQLFYKRGLQWPVFTPNGPSVGGTFNLEEAEPASDLYVFGTGPMSDRKRARVEGEGIFWIDEDGTVEECTGIPVDEGAALVVALADATYFIHIEDGRICVLDGPTLDGSVPGLPGD